MAQNHEVFRAARRTGAGVTTSGGNTAAGSADAHTVGAECRCVRIASGLNAFRFNINAAATATSMICPASSEIFVGVSPGDHIHVIQEVAATGYSITDVDG